MAARSGSLGRTAHAAEVSRKPPLPSFGTTKPRAKSDAKSEPLKNSKENVEVKHDKGDKTSDSNSDPGNNQTHNHKGEIESDARRANSHAKEGTKTEASKSKGDTDKSEPPKSADAKKAGVKTMVIPSRYMSKATPRTTTPINSKPTPKPPTTSSGWRSKTPEKSAVHTERHKTPTKQPTTPRAAAPPTATTMNRTASATTVPKRVTPTPTTPTRGGVGVGRKTPVPAAKGHSIPAKEKHTEPPPPMHKEVSINVIQQFNIKIAGLQAQIKQLALERDSVLFQQNSEGSEQSDWDESLASSVDGASDTSSIQGDYERDEKYIEVVKRYRSTLSVLSQKIVILKTALTDAKGEYDTLQQQHKQLLAAHQQSLSDLDKANVVASIS